jgi:hypothetical protein
MPDAANDVLGVRAAAPLNPVRALQWKLYRAAKQSRSRRFHALYDKVYRRDVLTRAWLEVARNGGAPGVDGVSIEAIETTGVAGFLDQLQAELMEGRTGRSRCAGSAFPSARGESAIWACLVCGTGWCRPRQRWSSNRCLKRISPTCPSGSDPNAARIRRVNASG